MRSEYTDSQLGFIWNNLNKAAKVFIQIHGWDDFFGYCQNLRQAEHDRLIKLFNDAKGMGS